MRNNICKPLLQTFHASSKVMEWLKRQPDLLTYSEMGDTSALNLIETIKVNHIEIDQIFGGGFFTKFTVSKSSGAIGIASRRDKPSLSIMYPGSDKPPLVLSRKDEYGSALFITISGQEYLAAASRDDICLWNLENNSSNVVYKFNEQKDWHLCLIDETTVASVAQYTSSDGFNSIYILKTDDDMWTLSSTHLVKMNASVVEMYCMKTTDGTPCLLLSFPVNKLIQCLELVGGKIRWQVDEEQTGEAFVPWSICTDGSTVLAADAFQNRLHLMSVNDGSFLSSINLSPFGVLLPGCVRLHRD